MPTGTTRVSSWPLATLDRGESCKKCVDMARWGSRLVSARASRRLSFGVGEMCTWLSADGGRTWTDVAVGPYIYQYANQGSTVVMGKHQSLVGPQSRWCCSR